MILKDKILILSTFAFILIGIVSYNYDQKKCAPHREKVDKGIFQFYSSNSINKLTITNGKYGAVNSTFDSLLINDPVTLEEIRKMVLNIHYIGLTRHSPIWTLRLKFTMQDQSKFEIWLNKIEETRGAEFKVYKYGECEENHSLGSNELGNKILALIEGHRTH